MCQELMFYCQVMQELEELESIRNNSLTSKEKFIWRLKNERIGFYSWRERNRQNRDSQQICTILQKTSKDIIIIDDFQYIMANEFMRGVTVEAKGNEQFMKFNRIAKNTWDILQTANALPENKRVYILSHTQTDDFGKTKAKTIGKLLDEKITLEGLFTIVLRTQAVNGNYSFLTQNNGSDTVKSPMGLFESQQIDNDLAQIDSEICNYYEIQPKGHQDVQAQ